MTDVRVLVVDDASDIRRLLRAVIDLHDRGWQVVADAADGREGVDAARESQPDLVLLDIAMPVMDGLEALPLVRSAAPSAVVVVLTGYPSEVARQSALDAGAHAFLEKEEIAQTLIPRLEHIITALRED